MNNIVAINKRGDVAITILVIGVVAVCALAIFSFITSSFNTTQSFVGVSTIEELNAKINSYYFYQEKGLSEEKVENIVGIKDNEIYLVEEKNKFFGKDEFMFSIKYIFP
jgi:hypothetical protein